MNEFEQKANESYRVLKLADHMLTVTYPLVQDPKILLGVLDHLYKSSKMMIESAVEFERYFRRIPQVQNNFQSKYLMFKSRLSKKYCFQKDDYFAIDSILELMMNHRKSSTEFTRDGKIMICDNNFSVKQVTEKELKKHVEQLKKTHNKIKIVVGEHNGNS